MNRTFKRFITFLLAFVSVIQVSVFAEFDMKEYSPLTVIQGLSIMDENLQADEPVTRRLLAKTLARMILNQNSPTTVSDSEINDVPADDEDLLFIDVVTKANIMTVDENGNFYPDDAVEYQHAVKALVCLLGYQDYAFNQGGYPAGYMSVGADIKLLRNSTYKSGVFTVGDLSVLLKNLLEIQPLVIDGYTSAGTIGYTSADAPYLNLAFKLESKKGIVTAIETTSLTGASNLGEKQIEIDGEVFECLIPDINDLLGMRVEYYFNADENEIKAIFPVDNDVLEIEAGDISNVDVVSYIEYYDDKTKKKQARFSDSRDIIYNGLSYNKATDDDLMPTVGGCKLIDNNRDGKYDVVFVNSAYTFVVSGVDVNTKRIYSKYSGASAWITADEQTDFVTITKNGSEISLDEIAVGNVVSAMISKNTTGRSVVTLQVSDRQITGTVVSMTNEPEVTIVIDDDNEGGKYKVDLCDSAKSITAGSSAIFYFDSFDRVVDFKRIDGYDTAYGFLISAAFDEVTDLYYLKVFTQDGTVETLTATERVKVDGEKVLKSSGQNLVDVLRSKRQARNGLDSLQQLIKFTSTIDGEITDIDTVGENKVPSEEDLRIDIENVTSAYKYVDRCFGTEFGIGNTIIIGVPPVSDQYPYELNGNDFSLLGPDTFSDDRIPQNTEVYNISKAGIPKVMVMYDYLYGSGVDDDSGIFVVSKIIRAMNSDDEETYKLIGLSENSQQEVLVGTDSETLSGEISNDFSQIKPGDVLKISKNTKGEAYRYRRIFTMDNMDGIMSNDDVNTTINPDDGLNMREYGDMDRVYFGNVVSIEGKNMVIEVETPDDTGVLTAQRCYFNLSNINNTKGGLYRYVSDSRQKEYEIATEQDVIANEQYPELGSTVMVITKYMLIRAVVIFD